MGISVQGPSIGTATVCEPILRALPQWFGMEDANTQYVRDIETMPTMLALVDGQVVGFLTLKHHSAHAAEIHVMGVHPARHRQGIGRLLLDRAEQILRQQGIEYLQVKTLSPSHPDEGYARTRAFYKAMGFSHLEAFKELWDKENPCLQMVKWLGSS